MPPKIPNCVRKCCVPTCGIESSAEPKTIFIPLPDPITQQDKLQRWLSAIARPDLATRDPTSLQDYFVCQRHFRANLQPRSGRIEALDPTQLLPTIQGPQPGPSAPPLPPPPSGPLPKPPNILIYSIFANKQSDKKQTLNHNHFKDFCIYLYQCCALQYKSLGESLKLLPMGALRRHVRRAAAEPGAASRMLELKALNMPLRHRDCTLSLGTVQLAPGFFYNIRDDVIVGVGESESEQQSGQATRVAAVAALQGLTVDWRLPLAHTQRGALEPAALVAWLDVVAAKLPRDELAIHALVTPLEPLYYRAARLRGVSEEDPNIELNGTKVCFFFDSTSVMKNVRYHLMHSKIYYKNQEVKWDHIVEYFNLSQILKMKLTPNLTESEMFIEESSRGGGGSGVEALRRGVARAMSVLAQLGHLSAGAAHTADFLVGINDAHDLCSSRYCSTQNSRKRPYSGENTQERHLKDTFDFFNEIKLVESEPFSDLDVNFANAFKINLSSIQFIHSILQRKSIFQLSTHRLSNCTDFILKQIEEMVKRKRGKALTSSNFTAAFNSVFVAHFMRPSSVVTSEKRITKFLDLLQSGLSAALPPGGALVEQRAAKWLVPPRLYRELPARPTETYLAGFILAYCLDRHQDCPAFRAHVKDCCMDKDIYLKQQDFYTVSGYKNTWRNLKYDKVYLIEPPMRFLEFLQRLERVFRSCVARGGLAAPVIEQLEAAVARVTLPNSHCTCFPVALARYVFLRLRLCLTLRHNNAALRRGQQRGALNTAGLKFDFLVSRFKTVVCD